MLAGAARFRAAFIRKCIMARALCLVIVIAATSSAAWAQTHTAAEERACRGDAHRLCKEVLHDEFQVASCLQEHRDRVSRACRAVMESH
jgi:Cysteine rich repeat